MISDYLLVQRNKKVEAQPRFFFKSSELVNSLNSYTACIRGSVKRGFHGEPAFKKHYKPEIQNSTSSRPTTRYFIRKCIL